MSVYMQKHIYMYIQTYMYFCICTHICIYTHAQIHTYMHAYIQILTYIQTYIRKYKLVSCTVSISIVGLLFWSLVSRVLFSTFGLQKYRDGRRPPGDGMNDVELRFDLDEALRLGLRLRLGPRLQLWQYQWLGR